MQGGFSKGAPGADMNNLIQVQSLQMQAGAQPGQVPPQMQQMAGGGAPPGMGGVSGGLGVDMGGMLVNSQFNRQQHSIAIASRRSLLWVPWRYLRSWYQAFPIR